MKVEPQDVESDIPPERARELRALVEHVAENSQQDLLDAFRSDVLVPPAFANLLGVEPLPEAIAKGREQLFLQLIHLAQVLGVQAFFEILNAVFDFDEFTPAAGAPDLLLWSSPGMPPFWCFSEVKAPGDHLQASQTGWLREHWDVVCGHYVLTVLEK